MLSILSRIKLKIVILKSGRKIFFDRFFNDTTILADSYLYADYCISTEKNNYSIKTHTISIISKQYD